MWRPGDNLRKSVLSLLQDPGTNAGLQNLAASAFISLAICWPATQFETDQHLKTIQSKNKNDNGGGVTVSTQVPIH